jgi:lipoprotein NlpD
MDGRMKRAHDALAHASVLAFVVAALAACGTAKVYRTPGQAAPAPRLSQPKYGATAKVQKGQTLYRIAVNNGISPMDLALWNDIPPPYTIHPGDTLRLYPPNGAASKPATASAATRPGAAQPPQAGRAAAPASAPRPVVAPPPAAAPQSSGFRWRWPTEGGVVGGFVAGDATQQGIDIAGSNGQPVLAAADGTVVYSGAGLVGYGELVIIKHSEQWLSAYGHNSKRLVNEGQIVRAGQQIAEMGHSGASRDMLHFEIRYNGKPVDPRDYLPRK